MLQTRSVPGVDPHCVVMTVELVIESSVVDCPVPFGICIGAIVNVAVA